ncbi:MAG: ATP-dependent metallopeptidase FtsH/Yme1/Tma family protein [Candidatus Latescibacteria bacterium]|nr:ATP-dependent metallopeptidase FtsH/Yme1/Tma family protein [Candidatus Latescibacterota bacterium]
MARKQSGPAPRKSARPPRPPQRKQTPFGPAKPIRTALLWLILVLGVILFVQIYGEIKAKTHEIPYSEFLTQVEGGNLKAVTIVDREVVGELKQSALTHEEGRPTSYVFFKVYLPAEDKDLGRAVLAKSPDATVNSKPASMNWWSLVLSYIPFVALVVLWMVMIRQIQSGGANAMKFGKSRPKVVMENSPKVTFKDVAGADEAKQELEEIIEFLREPKKFQRLGGRIPKGALLLGPPGTGKTLLAKAVAGEAGVPFFSLSGSDFVEMFVGVGASRVRDLFDQGKRNAPCIIFIDEIDAVGRHRGAGLGGGHDEREQTLNQLLVEMDGFESNDGVILIAATNRPDVLDPALLRPGRFDRQIVVDVPDVRGREGILRVHTRNIPISDDVVLNTIARGTPGMVGADLANLVNEAALLAARRNHKKVSGQDLEDAKDKVMMGTERRSLVISDEEKKSTSYHEAGHALVAYLQPGSDKVHKVTIIPRGRALGLTAYLPQDERHSFSREYWLNVLTHLMGGRAAEQIVLNQLTTGAQDDIRRATNIARRMVCEWGMSDRLGPLTFGAKEEFVFLGREISQSRDYSEKTAIMIDEEVRSLVDGASNRARQLLTDNVEKLHVLAHALLEREMLDGEEIEKLLRGEKLEPLRRSGPTDGTEQSDAAPEEADGKQTARAGAPAPRIAPSESPGVA